MREFSSALQQHLDSGATTLCWCWRLTRKDGVQQGFTDHDRDLEFDGTLFAASDGFQGAELSSAVGLSVDHTEAAGALRAEGLRAEDLADGLYDDAGVEIFRVNWADPAQRWLIGKGGIGEVTRGENAFSAEIRSLAHYLNQPRGRIVQYGCDALLGDGRCGVDLGREDLRTTGVVSGLLDGCAFQVVLAGAMAAGALAGGLLSWQSGANAGQDAEIKAHFSEAGDAAVQIQLWRGANREIALGDAFAVTVGCNRQFTTCRDRFQNAVNYRGFPHIPGNDFLLRYPNADDAQNDGGAFAS